MVTATLATMLAPLNSTMIAVALPSIMGAFGWRSIFFANVPLVVAAIAVGWWAIPRATTIRRTGPFDLLGAVLLSALLLGLAVTLTFGVRAFGATAVLVGAPVLLALGVL